MTYVMRYERLEGKKYGHASRTQTLKFGMEIWHMGFVEPSLYTNQYLLQQLQQKVIYTHPYSSYGPSTDWSVHMAGHLT